MTSCRLRAILKCLDITREEIAQKSGVSIGTINSMASYGVKNTTCGKMVADALNVSLEYLEGGYDNLSDKYIIGMTMKRLIEELHCNDQGEKEVIKC